MNEDNPECDYGFGLCIDPECRDLGSCLGCPLLAQEKKGKVVKE